MTKYLKGPNSWPLFLALLAVPYFFSPKSWWVTLLFAELFAIYLAWAVAWLIEYNRLQRKPATPPFVIALGSSGVALLLGSLAVAPDGLWNFDGLRIYSRWLWGISLGFIAVAVYMECWRVYLGVRAQVDHD